MGGSRGLHPTFRGVRAKGGPQPGTTTTQGSPSFSWGEPRALVLSRGLGGTWGSPPRAQHVLKVWSLCCWVTSASPGSWIWGGLLTLYTLPRSPAPSLAASSPRAGEERAALGGGAGGAPQRGAALAAEPLLPTASPPASRRAPPGLNPPPSSCRMRPPLTPGRSQALRPPRHPHAGGSTAPSSLSRGLPPKGAGRLGTGGGRGSPELPLASRYQDPHPSPAGRRALGAGCQAQCSSSPQATGGSG